MQLSLLSAENNATVSPGNASARLDVSSGDEREPVTLTCGMCTSNLHSKGKRGEMYGEKNSMKNYSTGSHLQKMSRQKQTKLQTNFHLRGAKDMKLALQSLYIMKVLLSLWFISSADRVLCANNTHKVTATECADTLNCFSSQSYMFFMPPFLSQAQ